MTEASLSSSKNYWVRDYLRDVCRAGLQAQRGGGSLLWPNTPDTDDIQKKIIERVGVDDWSESEKSRGTLVIRVLELMQATGDIPDAFTLLDVACGDAVVLYRTAVKFNDACCWGLDPNAGRCLTHWDLLTLEGFHGVYRGFLQDLVFLEPPQPFDVVMMLNTFRNWDAAQLSPAEKELPQLTEDWLLRNARHVIVTASPAQIARLEASRKTTIFGKGEEDSHFLLIKGDLE